VVFGAPETGSRVALDVRMQVQALSTDDDNLTRSVIQDDDSTAHEGEEDIEEDTAEGQADAGTSRDAIADSTSGALAMGLGSGGGWGAFAKALKMKGLPSIYKGVPTAGPLARTGTATTGKPSLARRAGGALGRAVGNAKKLTRGGSTGVTTGAVANVAAASELKRGSDGGIEADMSIEVALQSPSPIAVAGVPGAALTVQPALKTVLHLVAGNRGITEGKAEVEGSALVAFTIGIPNTFEAYAGFNAKLTGGAALSLDAPKWDLMAAAGGAANWQLGVKLFGNESTFKFPELKIFTLDGLRWTDQGSKCQVNFQWTPEFLKKIEPATNALEQAKKMAQGTYDPATGAEWIRKRFGF
jgi:hypothetical protein